MFTGAGNRFINIGLIKKLFKIYKNYAIEFLENCIVGYYKKYFTFYNKAYTLDQLEIEIIYPPNNIKVKYLHNNIESIPILSLGLLSVKYMLETKDLWLLRYILDNMYHEHKWFRMAISYLANEDNNIKIPINFSEFNIQDKDGNILSFLDRGCFIGLTKNADKNKLEMILTKLKHNEFNDRIKKAIKQWKTTNVNINN